MFDRKLLLAGVIAVAVSLVWSQQASAQIYNYQYRTPVGGGMGTGVVMPNYHFAVTPFGVQTMVTPSVVGYRTGWYANPFVGRGVYNYNYAYPAGWGYGGYRYQKFYWGY